MLSLTIFLPAICAILLLATDRANHRILWTEALVGSVLTLIVGIPIAIDFQPGTAALQFVDELPWVPSLGITYKVGLDGLSLPLYLLTLVLTPLAILASTRDIESRVKEFLACMLFLETGMLGVFAAADLFLFYVFWEVMLIPMVLLIGIWGGQRRIYAAVKFMLFTMAGSLFMLLAILALYFWSNTHSFDVGTLRTALASEPMRIPLNK